jgi:hypothetical protein
MITLSVHTAIARLERDNGEPGGYLAAYNINRFSDHCPKTRDIIKERYEYFGSHGLDYERDYVVDFRDALKSSENELLRQKSVPILNYVNYVEGGEVERMKEKESREPSGPSERHTGAREAGTVGLWIGG